MIVNQIFQHFSAWFACVIGSADYYYAFWINQLLGYHINNRISVNKHTGLYEKDASGRAAKVRKEYETKKMIFKLNRLIQDELFYQKNVKVMLVLSILLSEKP